MTKETGGPAFPTTHNGTGMTLRDYFAAKAMQAYVYPDMLMKCETIDKCKLLITNAAIFSYTVADAMLEARK